MLPAPHSAAPPPDGGQLEDVLDAAQAVQEGIEKGQQMGEDELVVEEAALAMRRLGVQMAQMVFDPQDQPPTHELIWWPRERLDRRLGLPGLTRHACRGTPTAPERNTESVRCKVRAQKSRTPLAIGRCHTGFLLGASSWPDACRAAVAPLPAHVSACTLLSLPGRHAVAANRPAEYVSCPRCNIALHYGGTKRFHEGTRVFDVLGGLWEALKNREAFDLYVCPRCGRVEFFVDGIGEEFRGEERG